MLVFIAPRCAAAVYRRGNSILCTRGVAKRGNFVSPNEKAKSAVGAQLVRIARKARLGYDDFLYISQQARKKLGLRRCQFGNYLRVTEGYLRMKNVGRL